MAIATEAHPAVRAFETDEDFVVEIELPAARAPLHLDVEGRTLIIRVPVPHHEREWRLHPDVTGV
jgi:HSP20 family molecular chaperone IbpA